MSPSQEILHFAGGQQEMAIGMVILPLFFSEDLEIRHSFLVSDNIHLPMLIGLDFILSTGAEIRHKEHVLRFEFDEDDVIDVPLLIKTRALKTTDTSDEELEDSVPPARINMITKTKQVPFDSLGFDINPKLPVENKVLLLEVLQKHHGCFAEKVEELNILDEVPVRIPLVDNAVPFRTQPYGLSREENLWLKGYLQRLLDADLIEPSISPWAAGIVLIPSDADKRRVRKRRVIKTKTPPRLSHSQMKGKMIAAISTLIEGTYDSHLMQEFITEFIPSTYSITTVAPELDSPKVSKKDPYRLCIDYRPLNK